MFLIPAQVIYLGVDPTSSNPLCVTSRFHVERRRRGVGLVPVPVAPLGGKRNYFNSFAQNCVPRTRSCPKNIPLNRQRPALRNSVRFHDVITLVYVASAGIPIYETKHRHTWFERIWGRGWGGFDGMIWNWWDFLENHARSEDHPSPIPARSPLSRCLRLPQTSTPMPSIFFNSPSPRANSLRYSAPPSPIKKLGPGLSSIEAATHVC